MNKFYQVKLVQIRQTHFSFWFLLLFLQCISWMCASLVKNLWWWFAFRHIMLKANISLKNVTRHKKWTQMTRKYSSRFVNLNPWHTLYVLRQEKKEEGGGREHQGENNHNNHDGAAILFLSPLRKEKNKRVKREDGLLDKENFVK